MNPLGGVLQGIRNFGTAADQFGQNVVQGMHNFGSGVDKMLGVPDPPSWHQQPSPQVTPQVRYNSQQVQSMNTNPQNIPMIDRGTPPPVRPGMNAAIRPTQAPNLLGQIGGAVSGAENFLSHAFNRFGSQPKQQVLAAQAPTQAPTGVPIRSTTTPTPSPYPGQEQFVQHMMQQSGGDPNHYRQVYIRAVTAPDWTGQYYGGAKAPTPPPQVATPTGGAMTANPNIQPNITIPYSQGGQYTLPSALAQTLMNNFDKTGQATNAATVLNHPYSQTYTPENIAAIGHDSWNTGENGSFRPVVDATNTDKHGNTLMVKNPQGQMEPSVDRGLFRINNATFYGLMAHPATQKLLAQNGIHSWEDMNDQNKNTYVASIIQNQGGWNRWFAAPLSIKAR